MKIRILGCHGSDHLLGEKSRAHECRACAFLVNDSLLVDAGTIGGMLSLPQQLRLRHVLVTHLHFDHIKGLPTLADSLFDSEARPLVIMGLAEVLKGMQTHIFNDQVYPDFTQIPTPDRPTFRLHAVEPGTSVACGNLRVTAVRVNHQVPAVGYLIDDGASAILCTGDTYETEEIWTKASKLPNLKAVFIEASFPDAMAGIAKISKHLTPSLFYREFQKLGRPEVKAIAYHLKPRYREDLVRELTALPIQHLAVLEEGQELVL